MKQKPVSNPESASSKASNQMDEYDNENPEIECIQLPVTHEYCLQGASESVISNSIGIDRK